MRAGRADVDLCGQNLAIGQNTLRPPRCTGGSAAYQQNRGLPVNRHSNTLLARFVERGQTVHLQREPAR